MEKAIVWVLENVVLISIIGNRKAEGRVKLA
jgi:hypothetical protein